MTKRNIVIPANILNVDPACAFIIALSLLWGISFPKNVNLRRTIICPSNINGHNHAFHITGWIIPNVQQSHNPSLHAPTGTETRGIAVPLYPPPPADEVRCDVNGTVNF